MNTNNSLSGSIYNTLKVRGISSFRYRLNESSNSYDTSFEKNVLEDFINYLDDNGYLESDVDEDIINDYFTGLFYDIETDEDLDDLNNAEDIIRHKYLNQSRLSESKKSKSSSKSKDSDRIIMKQGNVTCLKSKNKYIVFEDDYNNVSEYDNEDDAMRDTLNRCGINPDNELEIKSKK